MYPDDRRYTKEHEWVLKEDDAATMGITNYAQDQLGDIVYVEMPAVGDSFKQGTPFATVESVKAVSECYLPLSGEITEVNEALEDEPELVNADCYGGGWFVKVKAEELSELDNLKDAKACRAAVEAKGD